MPIFQNEDERAAWTLAESLMEKGRAMMSLAEHALQKFVMGKELNRLRCAQRGIGTTDAEIRWSETSNARKSLSDNSFNASQAMLYYGAASANYSRASYLRGRGSVTQRSGPAAQKSGPIAQKSGPAAQKVGPVAQKAGSVIQKERRPDRGGGRSGAVLSPPKALEPQQTPEPRKSLLPQNRPEPQNDPTSQNRPELQNDPEAGNGPDPRRSTRQHE